MDELCLLMVLLYVAGYATGFGGGRRVERALIAERLAEALGCDDAESIDA